MTRWLQAAIQKTEGAGQRGSPAADQVAEGVFSVKSVLSEGEALAYDAAVFPQGTACNLGQYPRTWNGRVVSLAVWRELTDWERHGPRAQHWNGKTGQWENPSDDCHRPPTSPRGGSDLCG